MRYVFITNEDPEKQQGNANGGNARGEKHWEEDVMMNRMVNRNIIFSGCKFHLKGYVLVSRVWRSGAALDVISPLYLVTRPGVILANGHLILSRSLTKCKVQVAEVLDPVVDHLFSRGLLT